MTAVGTITIEWAHGTDEFCAAKIGTLLAIEDKCGAGIAEIYGRLATGAWKINDVVEVIRLSLIGGGMAPERARKVIEIHVVGNPNGIAPSVLVSQAILEAVIVGVPGDPVGKEKAAQAEETAEASTQMTDASAAQESTVSGQHSSGTPDESTSSLSGKSLLQSMDTTKSMAAERTSPQNL